jgi:hypothetical protein
MQTARPSDQQHSERWTLAIGPYVSYYTTVGHGALGIILLDGRLAGVCPRFTGNAVASILAYHQ